MKNELSKIESAEEKNKEIEFKFEKLKNKIINLYDKSKIITIIHDKGIQFAILDTGNTKTAYGYLKIINELKKLDYRADKIQIIIVSYSQKRAESLKSEFEETQKERIKALEIMEKYEKKTGIRREDRNTWLYDPPQHYIKSENIYYNTPKVEVRIIEVTWYMENYKKNVSYSESYIKEKDKKAIKDLKERFNKEKGS